MAETSEAGREQDDIFYMLKGKKKQLPTTDAYLVKWTFRNKEEMKTCPNKQKLGNFIMQARLDLP